MEISGVVTVYREEPSSPYQSPWVATFPNGMGEARENTLKEARELVEKWWGCTNWRRVEAGRYLADTAYRR